jgi:DNA-binding winged helix-turn-helix (wHTH) protein
VIVTCPDTTVSDELPRGDIRELRQALRDDAKKPRYIETVAARGYRFVPRVELGPPFSPDDEHTRTPPFRTAAGENPEGVAGGDSPFPYRHNGLD